MIKLIEILSEIRLINFKSFPKDVEWVYKVNNIKEAEEIFKILNKKGFKWLSGAALDDWNGWKEDERFKNNSFYIINFIYDVSINPGIGIRVEKMDIPEDALKLNEINLKQDITVRIKSILRNLKTGDKVEFIHPVEGTVETGIIRYFEERPNKKEGSLIIKQTGTYFNKHIPIYVDFTSKINNKTSKSLFSLQKIS